MRRLYWQLREAGVSSLIDRLPMSETGDRLWTIARYYQTFRRLPDLDRPTRFSEYLAWLKLADDGRRDLRARVSDKALVKAFVEERLGPDHTPRTLALIASPEEARRFDFPDDCVVKPTHMSGEVIVRRGGEPLDRERIAGWFRFDYYAVGRETNYRSLVPRVIVEQLLVEPGQDVPRDYKVFCAHGWPVLIQVDEDRFGDHRHSFYSPSWTPLPFEMNYPRLRRDAPRPELLPRMLEAAERLASDFCFLRVDFYVIGERLYVGELTNVPQNGQTVFLPDDADADVGRVFLEGADIDEVFAPRAAAGPRTLSPVPSR